MHYVYLLESTKDKSWYIGLTPISPFKRLVKHNNGSVRSTKGKLPWKLVYFEAYVNRTDAAYREKFLKSGAGRAFLKKQLSRFLARKED